MDLILPPIIPGNCTFEQRNILSLEWEGFRPGSVHDFYDFICASPPCEEFSKFGLRCFWPDPPYPSMGLRLFNHTREMLWKSEIPHVIENVRAAQDFVGRARHHCGPFYLWGSGVPPLVPQWIQKGLQLGNSGFAGKEQIEYRKKHTNPSRNAWSGSKKREDATAEIATIPPELANCVADYAERLCEQKRMAAVNESGCHREAATLGSATTQESD